LVLKDGQNRPSFYFSTRFRIFREKKAMKWLADPSVLVPVFISGHVHHERSFRLFSRANVESAVGAAHSIAEVYATITRLPGKHRASGQQAVTFLEMIQERFRGARCCG
jgi:hypothetical protein